MHADSDEALRRFGEVEFVTPTPALMKGVALVLSGDLEIGDDSLEDAVSVAEETGAAEDLAIALCERSLVAMARDDWTLVERMAEQARTALHRDGFDESVVTPFVCSVHARVALQRGGS